MPSPFPGMDPYLEGEWWTTFHSQLGVEIARQLVPKLRPRYLALPQKRYVMDVPDGVAILSEDTYPDVAVTKAGTGRSTVAAVLPAAPVTLRTVMPSKTPEFWVEIRDVAKRRLVAVIQILSPTNKRGRGRREYLAKRTKTLLSRTHLMEIDLLREGNRVPMEELLPKSDYFVFLSRVGRRPDTEVWPIRLEQPLPVIPVPLFNGDADVSLDLQLAMDTIYDVGGYDIALDYRHPPDIPLPKKQAAWARERLKAAGLG